jgi:hypothetical protein
MHSCTDCGLVHGQADDAAAVEAAPVVEAPPGPNENDVAIAAIEADAQVAQAKLYADQGDEELRLENERLRGELAGMRQGLDAAAELPAAAAEPPAGAPVVVQPPAEPAPVVPGPPPAEETPAPLKEKPKSKNFFGF